MKRPSLRRRRSDSEPDAYTELETERRRRQWAEKLAQTSVEMGEGSISRAREVERLLSDLLGIIEAHAEAAHQAGAVRSGDLRLYRHAARIRSALDEIEATASQDGADDQSAKSVPDAEIEAPRGDPDEPRVSRNGGKGLTVTDETEFPALL